ncbi:MAG: short-chain dehydrogenase [Ferruginibacter sp.]
MTNEQVEKFLETQPAKPVPVLISFKSRNSFSGLFIKTSDFAELKTKNFWRIVPEANIDNYNNTSDNSLARIYNGSEFTRLSENKSKKAKS